MDMNYLRLENTLKMTELMKMGIYPITYRDGSWIYELNGKLILALNTL